MPPFRASYGGVELLVLSATTEGGRDWASHSPTRGDEHVLQDRGRRLRRVQCELEFLDEPAAVDDYLTRAEQFRELAGSPVPQLFTHPLEGTFRAVVEGYSESVDSEALCVRVSCSFVALQEPQAVAQLGAGAAPTAGPEEVGVAADVATAQFTALGVTSPLPDAAKASVESWATAETPDARVILLELGSITGEIDAAIDELELATSFEKWELYKALINLRYSLVRAAETVTAETDRVVDFVVRVAIPLRALAARVYGAADAEVRADQIAKLNGIKRPGLLRPGTTLKIPAVA